MMWTLQKWGKDYIELENHPDREISRGNVSRSGEICRLGDFSRSGYLTGLVRVWIDWLILFGNRFVTRDIPPMEESIACQLSPLTSCPTQPPRPPNPFCLFFLLNFCLWLPYLNRLSSATPGPGSLEPRVKTTAIAPGDETTKTRPFGSLWQANCSNHLIYILTCVGQSSHTPCTELQGEPLGQLWLRLTVYKLTGGVPQRSTSPLSVPKMTSPEAGYSKCQQCKSSKLVSLPFN